MLIFYCWGAAFPPTVLALACRAQAVLLSQTGENEVQLHSYNNKNLHSRFLLASGMFVDTFKSNYLSSINNFNNADMLSCLM